MSADPREVWHSAMTRMCAYRFGYLSSLAQSDDAEYVLKRLREQVALWQAEIDAAEDAYAAAVSAS